MERRRVLSLLLLIGIIGYFSVPNVANYVVHAGGGNAILQKVNAIISSTNSTGMKTASSGAGMAADMMGNAYRNMQQGYAASSNGDYLPDQTPGQHQHDKLSGKEGKS